jgi:hypothetical protein
MADLFDWKNIITSPVFLRKALMRCKVINGLLIKRDDVRLYLIKAISFIFIVRKHQTTSYLLQQ